MGADQEAANINMSSKDKERTLSINPKFLIIGSVAAVLGVGAIAGLSYKVGKSTGMDVSSRSGTENGKSGSPPAKDQDPKTGQSDENVSNNGKDLDGKGSVDKSHEQGNKAPVNDEALAKKWTSVRERKYSELEPDLKKFALENKATAPPEMKAYLENLELYEFADTLNEKFVNIKKIMDSSEFDLPNEKKQFLKNVMKTCQKQGLLPMTDEERHGPIKEFLNKSSNLNKTALDADEEANESFCALGKLKEAERSNILGSDATKYNELLKNYLAEVFNVIAKSPELLYFFKKDYGIFAQSLYSQNLEIVTQTLNLFNRFLLKDNNFQNKQSIVDLEVIPQVISLLSENAHTSYVVKAGAIPLIVGNVTHSNANIREFAIRALGNIARYYDPLAKSEFRDIILDTSFLSNLLQAVQMEQPASKPNLSIIQYSASTLWGIYEKNGGFNLG